MSQVNLRIPKDDYLVLEIIAKKKNIPITSLFREIINSSFNEWKIKNVFDLYANGEIGFKKTMKLSGLSPFQFLDYIEKKGIEPPHSDEMEKRSEKIASKLKKDDLIINK